MGRREVENAVECLLGERERFSSAELSRKTGLTRQALHRHLSDWVDAGRLVREGQARATRYRRPVRDAGPSPGPEVSGVPGVSVASGTPGPPAAKPPDRPAREAGLGRSYPVAGLAPHIPWRDLEQWLGAQAPRRAPAADKVLRSVVTALVRNAVEHSGSRLVTLRAHASAERVALSLKDEGCGAFEHIRATHDLDDHLQAVRRLSGGLKAPQSPQSLGGRGEAGGDPVHGAALPPRGGLQLASRLVRLFELDANGLEWVVDNELPDQALSEVSPSVGTEVRVDVSLHPTLTPDEVEDRLIDLQAVPDTHVVPLGERGTRFVTRSQSRDLTRDLARYREVVLDFQGVEGLGLGFVDETFRVWMREHPRTRLVSRNANAAVQFLLDSGRRPEPTPDPGPRYGRGPDDLTEPVGGPFQG